MAFNFFTGQNEPDNPTKPFLDWMHETDPAKQIEIINAAPAGSIVGASDYQRPLYKGTDGKIHQDSPTGPIYGSGDAQQALNASVGAVQATNTAWTQDQASQGKNFDKAAMVAQGLIGGMGAATLAGGLFGAGPLAGSGVANPGWVSAEGGTGYSGGVATDALTTSTPFTSQTPYTPDPSQFTDATINTSQTPVNSVIDPVSAAENASQAATDEAARQAIANGTATTAQTAIGTAAAAKAGMSIKDWAKIAIPVVGGIIGGTQANSKPAGTTTVTTDIPDWLKPYVTGNLDAAQAWMKANPQDNSLLSPATAQLKSTIAGDYLNSNPYIDATFAKARDAVGAGIDSRFTSAGRYGSGAHQGVLGTTFNNLATDIYGNNYANERKLQQQASTIAPAFTQDAAAAPFSGFTNFSNLTKGLGTQTTSPYFTNPAGGALSGVLAGYGLTRAFPP